MDADFGVARLTGPVNLAAHHRHGDFDTVFLQQFLCHSDNVLVISPRVSPSTEGTGDDIKHILRHAEGTQEFLRCQDFFHRIPRDRDADGIADAFQQ